MEQNFLVNDRSGYMTIHPEQRSENMLPPGSNNVRLGTHDKVLGNLLAGIA
jgi:hypothetical protein